MLLFLNLNTVAKIYELKQIRRAFGGRFSEFSEFSEFFRVRKLTNNIKRNNKKISNGLNGMQSVCFSGFGCRELIQHHLEEMFGVNI